MALPFKPNLLINLKQLFIKINELFRYRNIPMVLQVIASLDLSVF
jgi:hypothetical protein